MAIKLVVAISVCLFVSASAGAQVWKCKNESTGKIEYSGVPCDTKSTGTRVNAAPNEIDSSGSRELIHRANTKKAIEEEAERQVQAARQRETQQASKQTSGAYRCTRVDGTTFVRATPCPKTAAVTVSGTTVTGIPATGTVTGRVDQESISKEQACAEAKQKLANMEAQHKAQHMTMPADFKKLLENDIWSVCS
jgi:hypothetical protein